jgi:glucoamylase
MLAGISLPRRGAAIAVSVCALLGAATQAQAKPPAPGAPGTQHVWAPADKHGFGTAEQIASNAWFTLRQGSLSEIYYPDLSTPSFRGLQFAVTDGKTFLDRETIDDDGKHVEPLQEGVAASVTPLEGSLGFRQVTTRAGVWRLTKTYITDPARPTVLASVHFESLKRTPLQLYVLADPAPGNDGDDDFGTSPDYHLVSYDDTNASAVAATPAFVRATSGYRGSDSDPWVDLGADYMLSNYDATEAGNVVQGARTALNGLGSKDMTLAIGFGATAGDAVATADASLAGGFEPARLTFQQGWEDYRASLKKDPPESVGTGHLRDVYEQSLLVLAASEDKQVNRGASIASPTMPWIWGTMKLEDSRRLSGPYHLVWPRDLYHVATAQRLAGDGAAANRLLSFLWEVQKPEGDWWQNTYVDGTEKWTTEQLDQVSLPIVLAWWLGRDSADDWAHVEKAADYVMNNADGPRSNQERWENQDGYSPNTIATEIAGLICAAAIAQANDEDEKADAYVARADLWESQVEDLTASKTGPYSPKPYYLRVTKDGLPDSGTTYDVGDNFGGQINQNEIVDNSFLGLVLFGVKPWDDPVIQNSLIVGDGGAGTGNPFPLKVETPVGPVWHRFTFDGYGEQADGGDWDLFFDNPARQTRGRLWPLLTGERGEYTLLAGGDARPYLSTISKTANDGLMLPEQVWDDQPPTGETSGKGTRSATPLAWTHGQFVRLAWSIDAGEPLERPSIVACHFLGEDC